MARADGAAVVRAIVDVSTGGRAPKQNPALFALAMVASVGDDDARAAALAALPLVARTGTHLFLFARYVEQFRGWGRGLRRAVAGWYLDKPVADVALQAVKYRQREGWSHRDLLRLAHPVTTEPDRKALFEWVVRGGVDDGGAPAGHRCGGGGAGGGRGAGRGAGRAEPADVGDAARPTARRACGVGGAAGQGHAADRAPASAPAAHAARPAHRRPRQGGRRAAGRPRAAAALTLASTSGRTPSSPTGSGHSARTSRPTTRRTSRSQRGSTSSS